MKFDPPTSETDMLADLRRSAASAYGDRRADELGKKLAEAAHNIWLVAQQPLDLLDEEPDDGR